MHLRVYLYAMVVGSISIRGIIIILIKYTVSVWTEIETKYVVFYYYLEQ